MKKFILTISVAALFLVYLVYQRHPDDEAHVVAPAGLSATPSATSTVSTDQSTPSSTPTPTPTPTPKPVVKNALQDGSFIGPSVDAYYGLVQVKAVIKNGKIIDVVFLSYPNDRSTSREINGQAMPYLTQEAIQAQSANVDIISGATDTSRAFIQSLTSALQQAKS